MRTTDGQATMRESWDPLRGFWLFGGVLGGWLAMALPGGILWWIAPVAVVSCFLLAKSAGSRAAVAAGLVLQAGMAAMWKPVPPPRDIEGDFAVVVERSTGIGKGECRILSAPDPSLEGRRSRCEGGEPGDTLSGKAVLRAPRPAANPGGFDARSWAASAGIEGFLRWETDSVKRAEGRDPVGERARGAALDGVARILRERMEPASAALWTATLTARNDALPSAALETFRQSGLFHMLSVSGFHMAVLGGGLVLLLGLLRVPKRATWISASLVVIAYAWLLRFPPPVNRSALAFVALALAMVSGRRAHAGNALWLAAGVLLAVDPNLPFHMGAQLTFVATASLLWVGPALVGLAPLRWRRGRFEAWFLSPLSASVAATLATAPILAWHVGAVPWIGVPAGLVSAFAFSAGFLSALAVVVLGWLPAWASWGFAGAAEGFARAVFEVALRSGQWEPGVLVTGRPPAAIVVAGLAGCALLAATVRRNLASRAWIALGLLALGTWLVATRPEPARLRIVFLDAGQGNAALVTWPSGRNWLVDAGPASRQDDSRDAGRDAVFPAMRILGIRRFDAVVVSHADWDHYAGLGWLSHRIPPALLVVGADTGKPEAPLFDSLRATLADRGWTELRPQAGRILSYGDGARCEVLAPAFGMAVPRNQASLSLRFRFDTAAAIVAGDADSVSEAWQIASGVPLRSQVLLAGHHGSKHSTSLDWLRLVEPRIAVLSYGRGNRYGHPNPEVMERLDSVRAEVLRTPEGAVSVELSGRGWRIESSTPPFWQGPWRRSLYLCPLPWISNRR